MTCAPVVGAGAAHFDAEAHEGGRRQVLREVERQQRSALAAVQLDG
ncbi:MULTISPECIES: hypothetical protein [unclassified Pseudomonas]|nr:hypothetical protein [Pseudomonas sp. LBUM920]